MTNQRKSPNKKILIIKKPACYMCISFFKKTKQTSKFAAQLKPISKHYHKEFPQEFQ